jgi:hypothetical protein
VGQPYLLQPSKGTFSAVSECDCKKMGVSLFKVLELISEPCSKPTSASIIGNALLSSKLYTQVVSEMSLKVEGIV